MIFFPAIDLKDGECVRLLRGEMDSATVFSNDPAGQAAKFAAAGCKWLHVVDLNGAFTGRPVNAGAVKSIIGTTDLSIQLGGGIRDMETISGWLASGVRRVILGTTALHNPELVKEACRKFPGRIAVGIDAKNGLVAVEGWAKVSEITARDLALRFEDAGVCAIIHTDIARDGAMQGPNIKSTVALAREISTPLIVSGGVSSIDDLQDIKDYSNGMLDGVISGRAVYDGDIDVARAVALLGDETPC